MNDVEWDVDLQCGMNLWSLGYHELDQGVSGSD